MIVEFRARVYVVDGQFEEIEVWTDDFDPSPFDEKKEPQSSWIEDEIRESVSWESILDAAKKAGEFDKNIDATFQAVITGSISTYQDYYGEWEISNEITTARAIAMSEEEVLERFPSVTPPPDDRIALTIHFKDPDGVYDSIKGWAGGDAEKIERAEEFLRKWVRFGEYITVYFDEYSNSAHVLSCK